MFPRRDGSRRPQPGQGPRQGVGEQGFSDPFQSFFGGRSLLQDFFGGDPFGRHPFDDPFFSQPFGGMFGPSGSLFGRSMFGGFGHDPRGGYLEQRPYNQQSELRRGPVIEEVTDDQDEMSHPRSSQQPIIEHPDDEVRGGEQRNVSQSHSGNVLSHFANENNGNSRAYSYQSTSVTYGGSQGPYYSSSMRRTAAPNGVVEEEFVEKDSSGKEEHRVSRGVGSKGKSVTRKRTAEGEEASFQTLHNLAEDEAHNFNSLWESEAEAAIPGWTSRSRAAATAVTPGPSRGRALLPSSGDSSSKRSGTKRA